MLVNITIQNFMIWTPYIIFMVSLLGRAMRKITIFKKILGHNWKRVFSAWNQNFPKYIFRVFFQILCSQSSIFDQIQNSEFCPLLSTMYQRENLHLVTESQKNKYFPHSKRYSRKKTLRIKHVNRDSGEFASNSMDCLDSF